VEDNEDDIIMTLEAFAEARRAKLVRVRLYWAPVSHIPGEAQEA
jgi:hypothetical protein